MIPYDVASAFATIVGLIAAYSQEQSGRKQIKREEFLEWLGSHRHDELKQLISENSQLSKEMDKLLLQNTDEILEQLQCINSVLACTLSRIEGFTGIALTAFPDAVISDQAAAVLSIFANSDAQLLLTFKSEGNATCLQLHPGKGLSISEQRFIDDDLSMLVALGFLREETMDSGDPFYKLTRNGARYSKMLEVKRKTTT